ncbi:hypothetical protein B296_00006948, partial [Ensete ventricosum]
SPTKLRKGASEQPPTSLARGPQEFGVRIGVTPTHLDLLKVVHLDPSLTDFYLSLSVNCSGFW